MMHLDSSGYTVGIHLFRNVSNSAEIRALLLKGQVDATLINATLVPSLLQVLVAADKACLSDKVGKKRTRTIHTELLFNLSPSKSVTDSLNTFGISDSCQDILVAVFEDKQGDKLEKIKSLIQGELRDTSDLDQLVNWERIAQLHGVDSNFGHDDLKDYITSRSAIKDLCL